MSSSPVINDIAIWVAVGYVGFAVLLVIAMMHLITGEVDSLRSYCHLCEKGCRRGKREVEGRVRKKLKAQQVGGGGWNRIR